jgi:hypothetical protein
LKERILENLLDNNSYPWLKETILQEIFFDINTHLNETDYNNFICFATTIFDTHSTEYWISWRDWKNSIQKFLFPEKYRINETADENESELKNELALLYTQFVNRTDNNVLENLYEELKLTEWDKKIFSIAGFDEKSDFNDPFLQVDLTIGMNRFQIFWDKAISFLTESQIDELYQICNAIHLGKKTQKNNLSTNDKANENSLKLPILMKRCVKDLQ